MLWNTFKKYASFTNVEKFITSIIATCLSYLFPILIIENNFKPLVPLPPHRSLNAFKFRYTTEPFHKRMMENVFVKKTNQS